MTLIARELDSTFGELTSERFFGKDEVFVDDFKSLISLLISGPSPL